jgi:unsaturated pyranuronate lyase
VSDGEVTHYRWADMPKEELSPLIRRRLVTGKRMMLAHVYLAKGAIVPRHAHENEQLTYILEGTLRFWLEDDEGRAGGRRRGRSAAHPLERAAQGGALEDTLDVDVFSPPRQDWLDGTDAYLRGTD